MLKADSEVVKLCVGGTRVHLRTAFLCWFLFSFWTSVGYAFGLTICFMNLESLHSVCFMDLETDLCLKKFSMLYGFGSSTLCFLNFISMFYGFGISMSLKKSCQKWLFVS